MTPAAAKEEKRPMPAMSLYELTQEIVELDEALEEEGGDVTEGTRGAALAAWMGNYLDQVAKKIDNIVRYKRSLEAFQANLEAEREALAKRKAVAENKITALKAIVKIALDMLKVKKLKGEIHEVREQNNGGEKPLVLIVTDPEQMPERFIKTRKMIDIDAIREAAEAGDAEALKVAQIEERGTHIRFV